ncbi:MAG: DUF4340 domain-containing protein [Bacteroidetes bacterium]|jgi:hypothetical protein|nr:DUF4340 domain-containing protein [Bacteroidota bacterium]MBT7144376.1 DUF4340 domain-containing protein [Bacteroidota bacterium]MBT7492391.1 DUF4340 domain-containing protein [Bacteroidota bacterium]
MKSKTLIIILTILIIAVAITKLIDHNKGERSFKSKLITLDSANVTVIKIYPKSYNFQEVKLAKDNSDWNLYYDNKIVNADIQAVQSMINELRALKTIRQAARSSEKWEKFELTDSTGTRVVVEENGEIVADLMVGKFSYKQAQNQNPYQQQQQGTMTTYVRLTDEDEVYAVSGYLSMTFNREPNSFRNKMLLNADIENWTKLSFDYSLEESFLLAKEGEKWTLNGMLTDSVETQNFLNQLAHLYSSGFVDDIEETTLTNNTHSLTIEGNNFTPIDIRAYSADPENEYIITSTENTKTYFSGKLEDLFNKIFVNKMKFFKMEEITEPVVE